MKWQGRRKSSNLEDRRGMSRRRKAVIGGGGAVAVIVILLQLFGGDTGKALAPIVEQVGNSQTTQQVEQRELTQQEKVMSDFMGTVLADTEDVWNRLFREYGLGHYKEPNMVLFTDAVSTRCGNATAASGPFYCPGDQKIYKDLRFFDELKTRFGAKGGDFAIAYVTAHEVGHHIQTILGTSGKVRQLQSQSNRTEANRLSVAMELQADFYAGVWAHHNRKYLQEGDIEEALSAANAVGDDTIQRRSRGSVNSDSFTHGTSQQRMQWFMKGFRSVDL